MTKENRLKALIWVVPIVFGAGGFYSMMVSSSAGLTEDVSEVQEKIEAHEDLKAHPVTEERITQTEEQITEILTEQRAVRAEQIEQGENLAAICQATGANCK